MSRLYRATILWTLLGVASAAWAAPQNATTQVSIRMMNALVVVYDPTAAITTLTSATQSRRRDVSNDSNVAAVAVSTLGHTRISLAPSAAFPGRRESTTTEAAPDLILTVENI